MARHFGFCYGVENAIEIAYKAREQNPNKRVLLLSQMIHNPAVNKDLLDMGIEFIMDTEGNHFIAWDELTADDVVIIPAFGTTLEIERILERKGVQISSYNTTCPFVERVWNKTQKLGSQGYSIVIHGKPNHEETRATFSHSRHNAPSIIIRDMDEARLLADFITERRPLEEFNTHFANRYSGDFDPASSLSRLGVVNQTTMLATDTQDITHVLRSALLERYGEDRITNHFADTRDTLCYATSDNQKATYGLLETDADVAIVVGGYNSSNTSHIVEMLESKFPTYFIKDEQEILDHQQIRHFDYPNKKMLETTDFLPDSNPLKVVLTSGASCPDALVEKVMQRILSFYHIPLTEEEAFRSFASGFA